MRDTLRAWTEAIETFVLQVILEERRDKAAALARFLLSCLSKIFVLVVKLRRFLYDVRLLRDSTLGIQVIAIAYRSGEAWNETAYANPDFDKKVNEALGIADAEKRKVVMKDIEQILQDSGIIIQPYWRKLYINIKPEVKNHSMHPTYEHDFGKVWLDQA